MYRATAKKYPRQEARAILADLAASSPGNKGKWLLNPLAFRSRIL